MPADTLAIVYTSRSLIEAVLAQFGLDLRMADVDPVVANDTERGYMTDPFIQWGTDEVNFYCMARYAASELAKSRKVEEWTTVITSCEICMRKGHDIPRGLEKWMERCYAQMEQVQNGSVQLPGIDTRSDPGFVWSNVRVDPNYRTRKVRVEKPISDKKSTTYPQNTDRAADLLREPY
jgi:hypothetical protein